MLRGAAATRRHDLGKLRRLRVARGDRAQVPLLDRWAGALAVINRSLHLADVLDAITAQVPELLGSPRLGCAIWELHREDQALTIASSRGLPEELCRTVRLPVGLLAAGRAVATGAPVSFADIARDVPSGLPETLMPWHEAVIRHFRSVLAVPLIGRRSSMGALAVYYPRPHRFTAREVSLVSIFAGHAALAVENAVLYADARRHLARSLSLQTVGAALVTERDPDALLRLLVEQACEVTDATDAMVALPAAPDLLAIRVATGAGAERLLGMTLPVDGSLLGQVMRSGEVEVSDDVPSDGRLRYRAQVREAGIRQLLAVPLKVKDAVRGVLAVCNKRAGPRFNEMDVQVMTVLGNQAAIALENFDLQEKASALAVAEERNRLARELHDSVSQLLFSIVLNAEAVVRLQEKDPARALALSVRVQEIAQECLAEMRSLIFELRPAALEEKGLVAALQNHLNLFERRQGIAVALEACGAAGLSFDVQLALYRVAQEALANVAKHAWARRVQVTLAPAPGAIRLEVADDGRGFDPAAPGSGHPPGPATLGLTSMRERAELLGGRFWLTSAPGRGTAVGVEIPVDAGVPGAEEGDEAG